MLKKLVFLLLCTILLFSLCACGEKGQAGNTYDDLMEELQPSDSTRPDEEEKRILSFAITGEASAFNFLYNFADACMAEGSGLGGR